MARAEDMETAPGGRRGGLVALHTAVLLFGMAGLFGKWIAAGAMLIVFGRVAFAALALAALIALRGRGFERPRARPAGLLLACGGLLVMHWAAFFHSIQVSTVAVGLLAFSTAPVFAALLEPWWFREQVSARGLLASFVSLGGVVLMIPHWEVGNAVLQGASWGVVAGGSFAVLSLLNRELGRDYDAVTLAFYQDTVAVLILAPFLPLYWSAAEPRDWLLLVLLGVVFTALAHGLFIHSLKHVRARVATLTSNLEPIYGIALAALLLGEIPSARTVAGGALILAAVLWVSFKPESSLGQP